MSLGDRWTSTSRRVHRLVQRGREDQALRLLLDYVRGHPEDARAWEGLGRTYALIGNHRKAEEAYRRAAGPGIRFPVWDTYQAAVQLVSQGRSREAESEFRALVASDTPRGRVLGNTGLANLAGRAGRWEDARAFAAEAERSLGEFGADYRELGTIVTGLPGEEAWGRRLLEEALARGVGPGAHLLLGPLLEREDPEKAGAHLDRVRRVWRGDPDLLEEQIRTIRRDLARLRRPGRGEPHPTYGLSGAPPPESDTGV